MTSSFVSDFIPDGAGDLPSTAIAIARGWPLKTMFCASFRLVKTVGIPK